MSDTTALTAEERKAVWADVKFRLEYAKQKVAFKTFEAYFMKGRRQKLSATPDLSGTVLPDVLLRTQR